MGAGADGQYFENVIPLIVNPIKVGKCLYSLIGAEGYQKATRPHRSLINYQVFSISSQPARTA